MSAALKPVPAEEPAPARAAIPIIDVARPQAAVSIEGALMRIVSETKTNPLKVMRDYTALAFGPGRVSFSEFLRLRLFDDDDYRDADKREVIGWKRNGQINLIVNYRYDWWGLLADKIASASYLAAYGFPIIPVLAIFARRGGGAAQKLLRDAAELKAFLAREENYPLFGKPTEGLQSLGSIALQRPLPDGRIETVDGRTIAADDCIAGILANYGGGYVFQKFLAPHPDVRALCGNRQATVRMVTILLDGEPKLLRACWKIPAGANMADNYWRAGNILAQLDLADGRIARAISGTGLDLVTLVQHPDTEAPFFRAQVPGWPEMVRTVLEAAKLMQHVPMIGWDVAASENGPVIVEMNETPDFFLNQFADRRGVLDADFTRFMDQQKKNKAQREKALRHDQGRM